MNLFLMIFMLTTWCEAASLGDIENYLNELQSLQADFTQEDHLGNNTRGYILLAKPGKFRIETLEPYHHVLVGDKSLITFHNYELDQTSYTRPEKTVLSILLMQQIKLQNNPNFAVNLQNFPDRVELKLAVQQKNKLGNIILTFSHTPLILQQIKTQKDDQYVVMSLYNHVLNSELDKKNFIFSKKRR